MSKKDLNDKQRRFAVEYLVDSNATQAAIRAGYSKKTAYSIGGRLLKHVEVKALIKQLTAPVLEKAKVTGARVLEQLAKIAFAEPGHFVRDDGSFDAVGFARAHPAAISQIKSKTTVAKSKRSTRTSTDLELKALDPVRSLDLLGRHNKLFATDVKPGDVPKTEQPLAPPRNIHRYTSQELRAIVQRGQAAKAAAAAAGSKRSK